MRLRSEYFNKSESVFPPQRSLEVKQTAEELIFCQGEVHLLDGTIIHRAFYDREGCDLLSLRSLLKNRAEFISTENVSCLNLLMDAMTNKAIKNFFLQVRFL